MNVPSIKNRLFAISLAIVSFAAFAESPGTTADNQVAPEWNQADSNHDGFLTRDELVPFPNLVHHFDKIDMDGDTKISETEYNSWMEGDYKNR